jgi:hypothetical protein
MSTDGVQLCGVLYWWTNMLKGTFVFVDSSLRCEGSLHCLVLYRLPITVAQPRVDLKGC